MLTQALIHALPMRLFMRLFMHSLLTHGQPYCTVYKDRVDVMLLDNPPTTLDGWVHKAIAVDSNYRMTMEILGGLGSRV